MNINNPGELPKLQDQLATLQDRITLGGAELTRLNALTNAELYTVEQLNIQRKDLEERIAGLQDIEAKLTDDVTALRELGDSLTATNDKTREELIEQKDKLDKLALELNDRAVAIKAKEEDLVASKTKLDQYKESMEAERKAFMEKIEQIKSVDL